MAKSVFINDSVYGKIEVGGDYADMYLRLIQAPEMQRLHHVTQLGLALYDEPNLTHTRFSHSLGAFYVNGVMQNYIKNAFPNNAVYSAEYSMTAKAAALLHDCGHGPYSHVLEDVTAIINKKHKTHEEWGKEIIMSSSTTIHQTLNYYDPSGNLAKNIAQMIAGHVPENIYSATVSSQFDCDRTDWLLRDQPTIRKFDWQKILQSMNVEWIDSEKNGKRLAFVVNGDGITEMENYLQARYDAYQTLYQGSNKIAMEGQMKCVLFRLSQVLNEIPAEKLGMNENDSLVQYLRKGGDVDLETYLELDDSSVREAIKKCAKSKEIDKKLAEYSSSLLYGPRFVGIDIHDYLPLNKFNYGAILNHVHSWAESENLQKDIDYKIVKKGKAGYQYITDSNEENLRIMAFNREKNIICDIHDTSMRIRNLASVEPRFTVVVPNEEIELRLIKALRDYKNSRTYNNSSGANQLTLELG